MSGPAAPVARVVAIAVAWIDVSVRVRVRVVVIVVGIRSRIHIRRRIVIVGSSDRHSEAPVRAGTGRCGANQNKEHQYRTNRNSYSFKHFAILPWGLSSTSILTVARTRSTV